MGKKAKTKTGKDKATNRKVDKSTLPPPPVSLDLELGSAKLLDEAKPPGSIYKALDRDGYDDGGVADLTLVIDLEDSVLRRKRGELNYFAALKADLLPRVTTGSLASKARRDQKIELAKMLFEGEDDEFTTEELNPSEVYKEVVIDGSEDEAVMAKRLERLRSAKYALRLSSILRESACASLSLAEISKRYLACKGKAGAEDAFRCASKAVEIASDGFYDSDEIALEAEDEPKIDPKYEKNATSPGLSHPTTLKLQAVRVSQLCLRSAYLHLGNALSAMDKNAEAREVYEKVLPLLANESRCGRVDWERSSVIVNYGNTYSREGNFDLANKYYDEAEKLGQDHLNVEDGNHIDGMGIKVVAMRARAFALKKAGKEDEAKTRLREVLDLQLKLNALQREQKEKDQLDAVVQEQAAQAAEKQQTGQPVEVA